MADYTEVYDPTKTLEEYKEELIQNLLALNPAIDVSESTPMGNIMSVLSQAIMQVNNLSLAMYLDQSPYTASLQALINKYGALYGIEYKNGTYTQQVIDVVVTEPCNIYASTTEEHTQFQVQDSNGNIYAPTADIYFTEADIGTNKISFECITMGATSSPLNTITTILTTTKGIESVNNSVSYTTIGTAAEDEETFRERILKASKFYRTTGTSITIEDNLKNIGCDDAFIFKNYGSTTKMGVTSGAIAIIIKGGKTETLKKLIANILAENIQSAYMFGFAPVPAPSGEETRSYITLPTISAKVEAFKGVNNCCMTLQFGKDTITTQTKTNLDFSSVTTIQEIFDIINNAGFTNCGMSFDLNTGVIKIVSSIEGDEGNIKMIPTTDPSSSTDLYATDFLDGANQLEVHSGYIELAQTYTIVYPRYQCVVTFNYAIPVQVYLKLNIKPLGIVNTEVIKEIKKYIVEQATSGGLFNIYTSLNTMDFSSIIKKYLNENNLECYADDLYFQRENTTNWVTALIPENIYEYFTLNEENIKINNI